MDTVSISSKSGDDQLNIVLQIVEGLGLNAAEAILMRASFSGKTLEGEPVKTEHKTPIKCTMIWETDTKSIERMKTENLPVKIDCYSLISSTQKLVGFISVPVNNIPTVALHKALQVKPRWTKLICLSEDWRQDMPKLFMNIMITSKDFLTCGKTESFESYSVQVQDEENQIPCMLSSQRKIFIRLLKEPGLLQVGSIDTECEVFKVEILMKNIRYMENLKIPEEYREFFINYTLLGNQHTRALDKRSNRSHQVQEKVTINFRTSLTVLKEYFEEIFFIHFEIMASNKVFGASELKLNTLIKTTSLEEFLEQNPTSIHEMTGVCNIKSIEMSHELQHNRRNRPILEYKVKIHYIETQNFYQAECFEGYKRNQEIDVHGGGDCELQQNTVKTSTIDSPKKSSKQLSDIPGVSSTTETSNNVNVEAVEMAKPIEFRQSQVRDIPAAKPAIAQSEKADIGSILNANQDGHVSELPRLFSYNLHLNSIHFTRKPEKGVWQFSFFHKNADTPRSIINKEINQNDISEDNTIIFKELELKLFFTSHINSIKDIIKSSESCKLSIKTPRELHAEAYLDCKSLLISNKEKISGTILLKDQFEQVTANANIFLYLDDLGINFNAQLKSSPFQFISTNQDLRRSDIKITRTFEEHKVSMSDASLAYKMIEELEEWKEKQQSLFIGDLKLKESQFIERLKNNWIEKQAKTEEDFVMKAEKLSNLTKSLQDVQNNLKQKSFEQPKNKTDIQSYKQELRKSFDRQLMAIKERARRMEDDLMYVLKQRHNRFECIELCNRHLKKDNCELLQQVECLKAELKELKSNVVDREELFEIINQTSKFK